MEAMERSIRKQRHCALVNFDVRNTFNTLRWEDIFAELRSRGVPGYLVRLLGAYLQRR